MFNRDDTTRARFCAAMRGPRRDQAGHCATCSRTADAAESLNKSFIDGRLGPSVDATIERLSIAATHPSRASCRRQQYDLFAAVFSTKDFGNGVVASRIDTGVAIDHRVGLPAAVFANDGAAEPFFVGGCGEASAKGVCGKFRFVATGCFRHSLEGKAQIAAADAAGFDLKPRGVNERKSGLFGSPAMPARVIQASIARTAQSGWFPGISIIWRKRPLPS